MHMHDDMTEKDLADAGNALISWFENQNICMHNALNVMLAVMGRVIWELADHQRDRADDMVKTIKLVLLTANERNLRGELDKFFDE